MLRPAFLAMKKEKRAECGDKPCPHPRIIEEHVLGMTTGASACAMYGRDVTVDEKENPLFRANPATSTQRQPT